MLGYDWGNPSTIMFTGNQGGAATEPDQAPRQIFDQNYNFLPEAEQFLSQPQHGHTPTTTTTTTTTDFSHYHNFNSPHPQQQHHPFFDPGAFPGASSTTFSTLHPSMLSLDSLPHVNATHRKNGPGPGPGLMLMPKSEDVGLPVDFSGSGLGLNLGGRTYFSSSEDSLVNRLYRRSKMVEPGSTASSSSNSPRCQAQGCNADLSDAKHYHRRHKVCEFHSKAATVVAAGLTQRFCQQCSRFHLLSEFDNGKRSCRKRLADHNRRRRKTQQLTQENQKCQPTFDEVARSPTDSGAQPSSSVAVVSPPDYFHQRPHQSAGSSISSSLFFSSG